eukprot:scaffold27846_cov39-Phaeocystis_antarctica.AAC.4
MLRRGLPQLPRAPPEGCKPADAPSRAAAAAPRSARGLRRAPPEGCKPADAPARAAAAAPRSARGV